MGKYRKKPVEIEAIQMPTKHGDFTGAPNWFEAAIRAGKVHYLSDESFAVETDEGAMRGITGDYLIRGVEGELYPCRLSVFRATYEPVIA